MAKSKKKRKGDKRRRSDDDGGVIRVRLPEEGELLGLVVNTLGGGILQVRCTDDKIRQVMIPGKFRKRMWTRIGDVIALMPQYGLDPENKGTLAHRYSKNESRILFDRGLIPEEYVM